MDTHGKSLLAPPLCRVLLAYVHPCCPPPPSNLAVVQDVEQVVLAAHGSAPHSHDDVANQDAPIAIAADALASAGGGRSRGTDLGKGQDQRSQAQPMATAQAAKRQLQTYLQPSLSCRCPRRHIQHQHALQAQLCM